MNTEYTIPVHLPKTNFAATTAPGVNNDASQGYSLNSVWYNTLTGAIYICVDKTVGAAVWVNTSGTPFALTNGNGTTANGTAVDLGGAVASDAILTLSNTDFWVTDTTHISATSGMGIIGSSDPTGLGIANNLGFLNINPSNSNAQDVITQIGIDRAGDGMEISHKNLSGSPLDASITFTDNSLELNITTSAGTRKTITMDNVVDSGIGVLDSRNSIGLVYAADYSAAGATKGDRWIPDKGYNDATYAPIGSGFTVSGDTNNRLITADGAGGGVGEPNLVFDGSTLTVTGAISATQITGNIGFNTTDVESWSSDRNALEGYASNIFLANNGSFISIGSNHYNTGASYQYKRNGFASQFIQSSGAHFFRVSNENGLEDDPITWKTPLYITNNGNVELFDSVVSFGSTTPGEGVLRINDVTTIPSGTLASGGLVYVSGTDLFFHNDAGTATNITNHTHTLAQGATDVTATAAEVNLLDLAGLTAGWVLSADSATTASWKAPTGGSVSLGTNDQIPKMNAGGTDFEYSDNFRWTGNVLYTEATSGNSVHYITADAATDQAAVYLGYGGAAAKSGILYTATNDTLTLLTNTTAQASIDGSGDWDFKGNNVAGIDILTFETDSAANPDIKIHESNNAYWWQWQRGDTYSNTFLGAMKFGEISAKAWFGLDMGIVGEGEGPLRYIEISSNDEQMVLIKPVISTNGKAASGGLRMSGSDLQFHDGTTWQTVATV